MKAHVFCKKAHDQYMWLDKTSLYISPVYEKIN